MAAAPLTLLPRTAHLPLPAAAADGTTTPARLPWAPPRWLGALALVALLTFIRRPTLSLYPQFIEDDGVFFEQSYHHGWRALFIPYAGYLQAVPRLIAWAASFLPLRFEPAFYHAAAVAVCLAVVARIFRPGIRLPCKTALAIAIPLVPHDFDAEVLGNATNTQWMVALMPVLLLIDENTPTGWRAAWDLVLLATAGLSGPFVLLSVPLFAARWLWVARTRWHAWCLGVAVFCSVVQAWFIHRQHGSPAMVPTLDQWLAFLAWRPVSPLFFGRVLSTRFVAPGAAAVILLGVGVFLVLLNRHRPAWRWATVVFATFGGSVLAGSTLRFLTVPDIFVFIDNGDRYFFLPRLMLVWCLLVHARAHIGWRRGLLWVLLAAVASASLADLCTRSVPDGRWAEQVALLESGKVDTLMNFPKWRIFMEPKPTLGGEYADVLGETPLRILPPGDVARVVVGAEPFLQPHPGRSSLDYEAWAQHRILAGRYAAAPGLEGAVEFSVVYMPSHGRGEQVLWRGRLDPAHVPADRGAHGFEITLPPQMTGRIVLGSRPASDEVAAGGCWADIHFR
ncbi:MAG: hypothetical protein INR65_20085 [Gluconacetobacter diazotrophicus]|nr:hypothetical protein [Gluconacetobacter diazotrophicus]